MKIVLYGANETALYEHERQLLDRYATDSQTQKRTFDAKKQSVAELHDVFGAQSMFQSKNLWRVTNLAKNRSTKQRQEIVQLLGEGSDDVLIVMPAELTAAQKKLFDPQIWQLKEFKLPKVFFQFTEAIKTKPLAQAHRLLQQSLEQKNEWELHSLLARQFRLLLATKTGAPVLAPPFAKKQLASQANRFTEAQLIQALHTLFTIERAVKTGQAHLTWSQEIDRLLVKLYDEVT